MVVSQVSGVPVPLFPPEVLYGKTVGPPSPRGGRSLPPGMTLKSDLPV